MTRCWFLAALAWAAFLPAAWGENRTDRLIVHEWGTFTTLQDERGKEMLGINIDDEPVPEFVHNLEPYILNSPVLSSDFWSFRQKGAPRNHPYVSMRLETPVIYSYPPANAQLPMKVNVEVKFRGGWITEFYPNGDVNIPGAADKSFEFDSLTPSTVGEIAWRNVQVGTTGVGPKTDSLVWLAPRKVEAASITSAKGEHEKYIFYRGVAQQHSPLRVSTTPKGETIEIRANFGEVLSDTEKSTIRGIWLMEARPDGTCAYRKLPSIEATSNPSQLLATAPRRFVASDFSADNRQRLEKEMHEALMTDGLYADEATALLSTWQSAYFTSPGLRVFFTVPRVWTDAYLPLKVSGDPEVSRVMIGRVELVSDRQQEILKKLATFTKFDPRWARDLPPNSPAQQLLLAGRSDIKDLGLKIPSDFQLYLDLGRFRNALVAAEERKEGRNNIKKFMDTYDLHAYRAETSANEK